MAHRHPEPYVLRRCIPMRAPLALLVAALLGPQTGAGHHSVAGRFDTRSLVEVEGEITAVHWRSPHVEYTLDAIDANGNREAWLLEAAAPATLQRSGLGSGVINVGDHVRVAGWAPLTEKKETFLQNVLLPTGDELLLWVSAESRWTEAQANDFAFWRRTEGDPSQPGLGLFRVWSASLALPPRYERREADEHPLTPAARDALESFRASGRNLAIQGCVPKGMPLLMEQPYPIEFRRAGDTIELRLEEYDTLRVIHMDRAGPPAGTARTPLGYSVGEWDGDALVVKTTLIDWPWFSQSGIPLGPDVRLVERFAPSADGSFLDYDLTTIDPATFTEPVTTGRRWLYLPDQTITPYDCTTDGPGR